MGNTVKTWLGSFVRLLFPHYCNVCGEPLKEGEEAICLTCNLNMPRTNYHLQKDNPVEKMFWGKMPLERATSYFFYRKGGDYRNILHRLKYEGRKDLAETMGRFMAAELKETGFFEEIDTLIPVPLHPRKQRMRGYNQSEYIARGIAAVTSIPIDTTSITRTKNTESQTHKSAYERWENTNGIFRLLHPERFTGKHILIIDDVLTTGATITACADTLTTIKDIRISVLTLAMAE